ncbi:MAG: YihA family ribosome biogenesis GTP-binding protein [Chlamydiae bacterium]|nr:YihA family ribosome biogenesis GTP-binding protein [Chlamydiota bacterium]
MKKINFKNAKFLNTFVSLPLKGLRPNMPRFCFVGRSNVGKSSLINHLTDTPRLAKVSQVPGKTQAINFFEIDGSAYFFDLPGYGFSQTGKELRASWDGLMSGFLTEYRPFVFLLTDSRHPLFESDHQMLSWLQQNDLPFTLIATKADKLNHSQKHTKTQELLHKFNTKPLFYSVQNPQGKVVLIQTIQHFCENVSLSNESTQVALA